MTKALQHAALFGTALIFSAAGAFAAGMLAAPDGMTLYTFDKDKPGVSDCYGDCANKWPPFLGMTGEKMPKDWALMKRTDGTMQWTYDGKPTYFFAGDKKKGDASGDGMGKMWHIIEE